MLQGKTAIVTGAGGGIGRVVVDALLKAGANVAAVDISHASLASLSAEVGGSKTASQLSTFHVDIADYAACAKLVDDTMARFGGLHILVNNAAVGMGVIRENHFSNLVRIQEIEPEVWQRFMAVNLSGAWNMTRASIEYLLARKWGRIINVTTSFFTMIRGRFHPYGPSKAGMEAMSYGHAQEFEGSGVTVNVVVPGGPADTPMVPNDIAVERSELIPPSVMVPPILWLCSDAAGKITGNRYVAAQWDRNIAPEDAERACRAPAAWPQLAQTPVWPGGKPDQQQR